MNIARRNFITLLGTAAVAWPLAPRAQQRQPMRRIGVLFNEASTDQQVQAQYAAFLQSLGELGWSVGRNIHIDVRWSAGNANQGRAYAAELVALTPDVILATGSFGVTPLLAATRTIPIVFVNVIDPVSSGFVASMAHPGGNATGFTNFEYGISVKWLELLKQIAPRVVRVAILRDPAVASGSGQLGAIQAAAPGLRVEWSPVDVRDPSEIERALIAFSREPNGGLVILSGALAYVNRGLIIALAARQRLPAVYPYSFFVTDGGLVSYGPDNLDNYRRAASYVDRILKGEKPADLPVQAPVKYETVVNMKTAKALGLDVPPTLLAIADEVIE